MNYSLVTITKKHEDGRIDGVWLQHCMGVTLEEAIKRARDTEKINTGGGWSEPLEVAVVTELNNGCPDYSVRFGLERLD